MINKKKVLSDSLFLSIGKLLVKLKGIILIPFVIHYVGLANYGVFVQLLITKEFVVPLTSLGQAFFRFSSTLDNDDITGLRRDYWSAFFVNLLVACLGVGLIFLVSPIINEYILGGTALKATQASAFLVISGALWRLNSRWISALKHFKLFSIYQIFYTLIPYVAFVYGLSLNKELFDGILFYVVADALVLIPLQIWIVTRWKLTRPSLARLREFFRFCWPLMLSDINGMVLSKMDRYFIGYYAGPASIGIYNIVYSAVSLLESISTPFVNYCASYLPKLWDKGYTDNVLRQLREGLIVYLSITGAAILGLIMLLQPLVELILDKDLSEYAQFNLLIMITGSGIACLGTLTFFYQLTKYTKKTHLQLIFEGSAAIINIILNYYLVREYGIMGAGFATFISYFFIILLCLGFVNLETNLRFYRRVTSILVICASLTYLILISPITALLELALLASMVLFAYTALIFMLRVLTIKDLKRSLS